MKNKTEKKLDEEFEQLGIKPGIYHFRKLYFILLKLRTKLYDNVL